MLLIGFRNWSTKEKKARRSNNLPRSISSFFSNFANARSTNCLKRYLLISWDKLHLHTVRRLSILFSGRLSPIGWIPSKSKFWWTSKTEQISSRKTSKNKWSSRPKNNRASSMNFALRSLKSTYSFLHRRSFKSLSLASTKSNWSIRWETNRRRRACPFVSLRDSAMKGNHWFGSMTLSLTSSFSPWRTIINRPRLIANLGRYLSFTTWKPFPNLTRWKMPLLTLTSNTKHSTKLANILKAWKKHSMRRL